MTESDSLRNRIQALVVEMVDRGILFEDACAEFERHFITAVLDRNKGNLSKASEELRIHRNTLGKKIREYTEGAKGRGARTRRDMRRRAPRPTSG